MTSDPSTVRVEDDSTARESHQERIIRLVKVESTPLLRYFARRLPRPEDAADLLGETLVIVWRRAAVIPHDDEQARMWLYGVARKVLVTHGRTSVRQRALAAELRAHLSTQPAIANLGGGQEGFDFDRAEHVRSLIAGLPATDREIVRLVHWEGFSLQEIATLMRKPAATIRSRYARARRRLHDALQSA